MAAIYKWKSFFKKHFINFEIKMINLFLSEIQYFKNYINSFCLLKMCCKNCFFYQITFFLFKKFFRFLSYQMFGLSFYHRHY
jgi:hypothetical protein